MLLCKSGRSQYQHRGHRFRRYFEFLRAGVLDPCGVHDHIRDGTLLPETYKFCSRTGVRRAGRLHRFAITLHRCPTPHLSQPLTATRYSTRNMIHMNDVVRKDKNTACRMGKQHPRNRTCSCTYELSVSPLRINWSLRARSTQLDAGASARARAAVRQRLLDT